MKKILSKKPSNLEGRYVFSISIPTKVFTKLPDSTKKFKINLYCNNNLPTTEDFTIINNLPSRIEKLSISLHSDIIINNLNFPNNLIELELSTCKFNLDYLPEGLKILILNYRIYKSDNLREYETYTLDDFSNLPRSLEKIIINNKEYNGIQDLYKI